MSRPCSEPSRPTPRPSWNGTACQAVIANDRATAPASLIGFATTSGTLCVRIYDVGTLVEAQDYAIDVTHP